MWGFYKAGCVGSQEGRSPSSPCLCSCMHCVQFHRAARAQEDRDSKADHQCCCFSRLIVWQRYRNSQLEELVPLGQSHGDSPHSQLAASTAKGLKAAWLIGNADRTSFHCPYLPARGQGIVMDTLCLVKRNCLPIFRTTTGKIQQFL